MSTHGDQEAACLSESEWEGIHELADHEFTLDSDHEIAHATEPRKRLSKRPPPPPVRKVVAAEPDGVARPPRSATASGVFPRLIAADGEAASSEVLAGMRAELGRLQAQMRARDAYLRELERALDERTRQLAAAGFESLEDAARMFGRLRGQAFRVAELESEVRRLHAQLAEQAASARASNSPPADDDLRRIRGIGPRFAGQLERLGFAKISRIAAWSEADIARAARRLRITPQRIVREGWVEQARCLLGQGPNG